MQNSNAEILTPKAMVLRGEALRKCSFREYSSTLRDGFTAFMREAKGAGLLLLPFEDIAKSRQSATWKRAVLTRDFVDLQLLIKVKISFVYKLLSIRYLFEQLK